MLYSLLLFSNNGNVLGQTFESINEKYHITNPQLEVGLEPNEVKVDKFLNKVYVSNERFNSISILDSNSGTLKEVFINTIPHDVEVNDKIHHVYISGKSPSETVSIIDGRTDKLLQTLSLDQEPLDIGVNENDHSVYIITEDDFYKQTNNSQLLGIELKNKPRAVEVDESNKLVYIISDHDISIMNGTANAKIDMVIPLPLSPLELEINENTNKDTYCLSMVSIHWTKKQIT